MRETEDFFQRHLLEIFPWSSKYQRNFVLPSSYHILQGSLGKEYLTSGAPESYSYFSSHFNALLCEQVVDVNFVIRHVNAKFPGSTHDQYIFANSSLTPFFEEMHRKGVKQFYLLADLGYSLRPWILTPYVNPAQNSPEAYFNKFLKKVRNCSEQTNGCIKQILRCLGDHRVLHYTPEKASKIIMACVVIYNLCRQYRMMPEVDTNFKLEQYDGDVEVEEDSNDPTDQQLLEEARTLRDKIAQELFERA